MTTDRATWDAEVEAKARRLAQHVDCGHPNHGAADHDCRPFRAAPTYREWFDPGVMGPRDEDRDDFDPREDLDPHGHEADVAAARLYGGRG